MFTGKLLRITYNYPLHHLQFDPFPAQQEKKPKKPRTHQKGKETKGINNSVPAKAKVCHQLRVIAYLFILSCQYMNSDLQVASS